MKLAFLNVQLQACALKLDENSMNMLLMFLLAFAKDQNVIYVCSDKNIKAVSQNVIDVALKGTWGFTKSKGHDQVFKKIIAGLHSSLLFLSLSHSELIEGSDDI